MPVQGVADAAVSSKPKPAPQPPPPKPAPAPPPAVPAGYGTKPEPAVGSQPAEPGPVINEAVLGRVIVAEETGGQVLQPAPEPPPTDTPAPDEPRTLASGRLSHNALELLWQSVGGTAATADVAAAIAQAESGGDPSNVNNTYYPLKPRYHPVGPGASPEYSLGLWQINQLAHPQYDDATLFTPEGNARAALAISSGGTDFQWWSTYTSGAYRAYLGGGTVTPAEPGQNTPDATPPTKAPAGVQTAWGDVLGFYSASVPKQHDKVRSAARSLYTVYT